MVFASASPCQGEADAKRRERVIQISRSCALRTLSAASPHLPLLSGENSRKQTDIAVIILQRAHLRFRHRHPVGGDCCRDAHDRDVRPKEVCFF
jgi:hypothetical protein